VEKWEAGKFPLDVWGLDMNWRETTVGCKTQKNQSPDCKDHFYDHPATNLFPNYTSWFEFLEAKSLKTYFNDHPFPVGLQTSPKEVAFRWQGLSEWIDRGLTFWWFDRNWVGAQRLDIRTIFFWRLSTPAQCSRRHFVVAFGPLPTAHCPLRRPADAAVASPKLPFRMLLLFLDRGSGAPPPAPPAPPRVSRCGSKVDIADPMSFVVCAGECAGVLNPTTHHSDLHQRGGAEQRCGHVGRPVEQRLGLLLVLHNGGARKQSDHSPDRADPRRPNQLEG
jgi:hypothetical protein